MLSALSLAQTWDVSVYCMIMNTVSHEHCGKMQKHDNLQRFYVSNIISVILANYNNCTITICIYNGPITENGPTIVRKE